jgi:hypothetical protein
VHAKRDHGALLFIDLRNHDGITQCVFPAGSPAIAAADAVRPLAGPGRWKCLRAWRGAWLARRPRAAAALCQGVLRRNRNRHVDRAPISFVGFDVTKALFWAAVINGVTARERSFAIEGKFNASDSLARTYVALGRQPFFDAGEDHLIECHAAVVDAALAVPT